MILYFEGPDRCGKTTLAERFSADLDIPIIHFGVPPTDSDAVMEFFLKPLVDALGDYPNFILDRFHLSNHAYGNLKGGGTLSLANYAWLDHYLLDAQTWLFLMVDHPMEIHRRLQEEGEDQTSFEQVGALLNEFNRLYDQTVLTPKGSFKLPQLLNRGEPTLHYEAIVKELRTASAKDWNKAVVGI